MLLILSSRPFHVAIPESGVEAEKVAVDERSSPASESSNKLYFCCVGSGTGGKLSPLRNVSFALRLTQA